MNRSQHRRPCLPWRLLLLPALALTAAAAPQWRVQYFYDEGKATLAIVDMQFPSATRGVAVGVIEEGRHHREVAVVTSDGGAHWQLVDLPATPVSLFFLDETQGWMVTSKGLYQTRESGKSWHKVGGLPKEIVRVHFLDEQTGFAVGEKKKVVATSDGGRHWKDVAAADEVPGDKRYSAYTWITFATPKDGIITGWNIPPRRAQRFGVPEFPDWMDPEGAMSRREVPHLSYSLVTHDAGQTWKANSASLFGDVARVRLAPGGQGVGLLEYSNAFRYPSEAYKIVWATGKSSTIYRDRRFAISDVWLDGTGAVWLAGVAVTGQIRNVIPGRVQVLKSRDADYTVWDSQEVDYRAVANRVILAVAGARDMWLATDNGMILKLEP